MDVKITPPEGIALLTTEVKHGHAPVLAEGGLASAVCVKVVEEEIDNRGLPRPTLSTGLREQE